MHPLDVSVGLYLQLSLSHAIFAKVNVDLSEVL